MLSADYRKAYIVITIVPKMYIRTKKIQGKEYYYLVKGELINGKVKQKVIAYIGDKKALGKLYENIKLKRNSY